MEGGGKRCRRSKQERRAIVEETLKPGASVAENNTSTIRESRRSTKFGSSSDHVASITNNVLELANMMAGVNRNAAALAYWGRLLESRPATSTPCGTECPAVDSPARTLPSARVT